MGVQPFWHHDRISLRKFADGVHLCKLVRDRMKSREKLLDDL